MNSTHRVKSRLNVRRNDLFDGRNSRAIEDIGTLFTENSNANVVSRSSESNNEETNIFRLPIEIFFIVFGNLNEREVHALTRVSKTMKQMVEYYFANYKTLTIDKFVTTQQLKSSIVYCNIKTLHLKEINFTFKTFSNICRGFFKRLEFITISRCIVDGIEKIAQCFPDIKELQISNCFYIVHWFDICKSLEDSLINLKKLEILKVAFLHRMFDLQVPSDFKNSPGDLIPCLCRSIELEHFYYKNDEVIEQSDNVYRHLLMVIKSLKSLVFTADFPLINFAELLPTNLTSIELQVRMLKEDNIHTVKFLTVKNIRLTVKSITESDLCTFLANFSNAEDIYVNLWYTPKFNISLEFLFIISSFEKLKVFELLHYKYSYQQLTKEIQLDRYCIVEMIKRMDFVNSICIETEYFGEDEEESLLGGVVDVDNESDQESDEIYDNDEEEFGGVDDYEIHMLTARTCFQQMIDSIKCIAADRPQQRIKLSLPTYCIKHESLPSNFEVKPNNT